mmetsp:Transcript_45179/g.130855  ORF Transcript_45179/g.130855 Transcript_45179/m.130855 type:complete len:262 (-) Transcript_45179:7-792(-)
MDRRCIAQGDARLYFCFHSWVLRFSMTAWGSIHAWTSFTNWSCKPVRCLASLSSSCCESSKLCDFCLLFCLDAYFSLDWNQLLTSLSNFAWPLFTMSWACLSTVALWSLTQLRPSTATRSSAAWSGARCSCMYFLRSARRHSLQCSGSFICVLTGFRDAIQVSTSSRSPSWRSLIHWLTSSRNFVPCSCMYSCTCLGSSMSNSWGFSLCAVECFDFSCFGLSRLTAALPRMLLSSSSISIVTRAIRELFIAARGCSKVPIP